jgi:hypothetical protein
MPLQRAHRALVVLIVGVGVSTAILFARGFVVPGLLGAAVVAGLVGWVARAAKERRPGAPAALPAGAPRPASVPPDGHIRFTLVVEGLDPDRVAAVWAELCRADRPPTEDLRRLFRNFTVTEGRRFRFLNGDPTATAALLTSVLGAAAGVPVRTSLEPAAERTPPWS